MNVTAAALRRDGGKRRAENVTCAVREECAAKEFKIDANDVARMSRERDCT